MTAPTAAERARGAVEELGGWVAGLCWVNTPPTVQERLRLVLFNTLAVTRLGALLPEQQALVAAWEPPPGPVPIWGTDLTTVVDVAAHLSAVALVSLELDEGNKYARGHPAAHGFPAVLALSAELDTDGPTTAAALLAAYEVAARFGRASALRPGAHPHGNWGVAGAAAGCARLLGLDATATAGAIDAGSALPVAGHFASALDGNPVRNSWMGQSNVSGLVAARLARAGLARNTGSSATSLGELLGRFDERELTAELGTRWDITRGYFKRHASCSYTHPAADAILALRGELDPAEVCEVILETHTLGAGLNRTSWDNRLAAMFSTQFVIAAALLRGAVGPAESGAARDDADIAALAARVRLEIADDIDARLPDERAARITVRTRRGAEIVREVPNPVGDADYRPFDADGLAAMLADLLHDSDTVEHVRRAAWALPTCRSARALLTGASRA